MHKNLRNPNQVYAIICDIFINFFDKIERIGYKNLRVLSCKNFNNLAQKLLKLTGKMPELKEDKKYTRPLFFTKNRVVLHDKKLAVGTLNNFLPQLFYCTKCATKLTKNLY